MFCLIYIESISTIILYIRLYSCPKSSVYHLRQNAIYIILIPDLCMKKHDLSVV